MAAATFLPGAAATAADEPPLPSESIAASRLDLDGQRCVVRLHGKSGGGQETYADGDGVLQIAPDGNADGWGGRQWLYFPDDRYDEARDVVAAAIEDCDAVILDGFSNGAAFVAKVFCRGETFEGRLIRVVIDDPVPDAGVTDCAPAEGVDAVLYWTGGLAETAQPGWDCGEGDWTCEGGTTIGIDAYAEALGIEPTPSPHTGHEWFWDAPELTEWTTDGSPASSPASSPVTTEPG